MDVFADPLCPWCYVAKHSLEAALRRHALAHPDVGFQVVWRAFCLAPLLKTRCDKRALYDAWSAGSGGAARLERVRAACAQYGLTFALAGSTGPSRLAQVLIASVLRRRGPPAQARVVEALFRGHFADGRDLCDEDWLVALGRDVAGLPDALLRADLRDDDARRRVDEQAELAVLDQRVDAVPCVLVLGRYKIGGYQDEAVLGRLLDRIRAENMPPAAEESRASMVSGTA